MTTTASEPGLVLLPDLGEDIEEADVLQIYVRVGDVVALEQPLVEIETEKATLDLPSSVAGAVTAIHVSVGDTIAPGDRVLSVDLAAAAPAAQPLPEAQQPSPEPQPEQAPESGVSPEPRSEPEPETQAADAEHVEQAENGAAQGSSEPKPRPRLRRRWSRAISIRGRCSRRPPCGDSRARSGSTSAPCMGPGLAGASTSTMSSAMRGRRPRSSRRRGIPRGRRERCLTSPSSARSSGSR